MPPAFEPHYNEIRTPIRCRFTNPSWRHRRALTTGLLSAVSYVKDNRLLPRGFDKRTADKDIAVHGERGGDADFAGGGDPWGIRWLSAARRVRFRWRPSFGSSRFRIAGPRT